MPYRAVTTSVEGFVQQIACCYLRHGYWFYVSGRIPDSKEPRAVDDKLIAKYGIDVSESTRARRKQDGLANMQYLRHERFFVLMATKGMHHFFQDEYQALRDIRRIPLRYAGYSISYRRGGRTANGQVDHKWHAHVAIDRPVYRDLLAWFTAEGPRMRVVDLAARMYELPYEPYAPIRRQLLLLHRAVCRVRRNAGLNELPMEIVPMRRRVVRPFAGPRL